MRISIRFDWSVFNYLSDWIRERAPGYRPVAPFSFVHQCRYTPPLPSRFKPVHVLPAGFVPTLRRTPALAPGHLPGLNVRVCCDWLISHCLCLCGLSADDILSALGCIVGRKHPSPTQARQLKQSLPMMAVVLHLLTSQVCVSSSSFAVSSFWSAPLVDPTLWGPTLTTNKTQKVS